MTYNNPNELRQQRPKIRGVADIVFCIDFSSSMSDCIEGVKKHITSFVESLETSNPNMVIDWQLGFCAYSSQEFIILPFTREVEKFSRKLSEANPKRSDEFTPGAIDYCISAFEWRPVSNRFIVVFTDEKLKDGHCEPDTAELFPYLLDKITSSRTRLFYFGPRCHYYKEFEKISRAMVTYVEDRFDALDFSTLLTNLGKSVSQSVGQQENISSDIPMIYNLQNIHITRI